jgi:hypothetical protein
LRPPRIDAPPLLDELASSSEDCDFRIIALAGRYRVSTRVIEYQLENAGVSGMD